MGEQPGVDADRIAVVAVDTGAPVAFHAAAKSDAVKAVLVWGGLTDLQRWSETNPRMRNQIALGCGSTGIERNSPVNFADEIDVPVMLLHAELSARIPSEHSRRMFDALIRAGGQAELIVVRDERAIPRAKFDEIWPRVVAHFEDAFREAAP